MIPVFRPQIGQEEIDAISTVLKSRWIGLGPKTKELEEKFAQYIGVSNAVGLNSGTAALHLALEGLEIGSGDEVIVPSLTFVATVHAILYNKAKPVFADVDEDTLTINLEDIKQKITPKTKAIIVVHYGGVPCQMNEIMAIAKENKLFVIEDCAHAAGSTYQGKKVGSIGDIGCFSFHAVKNIATGDAGMLTTNNNKIAEKVKRLRWFGISKDTAQRTGASYDWDYDVNELGYKYHLNDVIAAMALVQFQKLENQNQKRKEIVSHYNQAFENVPGIETLKQNESGQSANWNYVIKVDQRDELVGFLKNRGISSSVHYRPIHLHDVYKKYRKKANVPVTEQVWKKIITLPLYSEMTPEEINLVITSVLEFVKKS